MYIRYSYVDPFFARLLLSGQDHSLMGYEDLDMRSKLRLLGGEKGIHIRIFDDTSKQLKPCHVSFYFY